MLYAIYLLCGIAGVMMITLVDEKYLDRNPPFWEGIVVAATLGWFALLFGCYVVGRHLVEKRKNDD